MAQMNVHVVHFARVDPLSRFWIRLVGKPEMNASGHGERSIQLRASGGSREDTHLKFLTAEIGLGDAARQFDGHGFGVTRAGEPAHAHLIAGAYEGGGLRCAHDSLP